MTLMFEFALLLRYLSGPHCAIPRGKPTHPVPVLAFCDIDWNCLRCTLLNDSGNPTHTCAACGAYRPRDNTDTTAATATTDINADTTGTTHTTATTTATASTARGSEAYPQGASKASSPPHTHPHALAAAVKRPPQPTREPPSRNLIYDRARTHTDYASARPHQQQQQQQQQQQRAPKANFQSRPASHKLAHPGDLQITNSTAPLHSNNATSITDPFGDPATKSKSATLPGRRRPRMLHTHTAPTANVPLGTLRARASTAGQPKQVAAPMRTQRARALTEEAHRANPFGIPPTAAPNTAANIMADPRTKGGTVRGAICALGSAVDLANPFAHPPDATATLTPTTATTTAIVIDNNPFGECVTNTPTPVLPASDEPSHADDTDAQCSNDGQHRNTNTPTDTTASTTTAASPTTTSSTSAVTTAATIAHTRTSPASKAAAPITASVLRQCIARFDFRPRSARDLEMQKGDRLAILRSIGDGWCVAQSARGKGLVPGNYLEPHHSAANTTNSATMANIVNTVNPSTSPSHDTGRVDNDYNCRAFKELLDVVTLNDSGDPRLTGSASLPADTAAALPPFLQARWEPSGDPVGDTDEPPAPASSKGGTLKKKAGGFFAKLKPASRGDTLLRRKKQKAIDAKDSAKSKPAFFDKLATLADTPNGDLPHTAGDSTPLSNTPSQEDGEDGSLLDPMLDPMQDPMHPEQALHGESHSEPADFVEHVYADFEPLPNVASMPTSSAGPDYSTSVADGGDTGYDSTGNALMDASGYQVPRALLARMSSGSITSMGSMGSIDLPPQQDAGSAAVGTGNEAGTVQGRRTVHSVRVLPVAERCTDGGKHYAYVILVVHSDGARYAIPFLSLLFAFFFFFIFSALIWQFFPTFDF